MIVTIRLQISRLQYISTPLPQPSPSSFSGLGRCLLPGETHKTIPIIPTANYLPVLGSASHADIISRDGVKLVDAEASTSFISIEVDETGEAIPPILPMPPPKARFLSLEILKPGENPKGRTWAWLREELQMCGGWGCDVSQNSSPPPASNSPIQLARDME